MATDTQITSFAHPIQLNEHKSRSRPFVTAQSSLCFQIDVHGYLLLVKYRYNYFNSMTYKICHFRFYGETASETGFQSHWVLDEKIDNVIDYAIEAANHYYIELKRKFPEKVNGQYSLL